MKAKDLKEEALELIAQYFGEYTKELYNDFYEDKSTETTLASLEELLIEVIGPKKTRKVLLPLAKKYHLTLQDD